VGAIVLGIAFLSTASWLWDETIQALHANLERPKLIQVLRWVPWYGWCIAGLLLLIWSTGEHAYRLIATAEKTAEDAISGLRKPDVKGSILLGYIDAKKFLGFGSNKLEDLTTGSYVSLLIEAVNHSECPAHFTGLPTLSLEIYGKKHEGIFENVAETGMTDLAVDDPEFRYGEKRLLGFFRAAFRPFPLERGIPHSGWVRFYLADVSLEMLSGREEIPSANLHIGFVDTLGGHHEIVSAATVLRVGRINLTTEVFKPRSA
jgi:hypothetical protein